jgi:hypothetical protein
MSKIGNQNALKHGAFADTVLLPGEDPEEVKELLAELYDEWRPEGPTQIDKVHSIALGMWRKRRQRRYSNKVMARSKLVNKCLKPNQAQFDVLLDILEDLGSGPVAADYLSEKLTGTWTDGIEKDHPRGDYSSESAWRAAVSGEINVALKKCIQKCIPDGGEMTIVDNTSTGKIAELQQAFEDRIDAKMDRDVRVLGQIKTMMAMGLGKPRVPDKIEELKLIESPPIQKIEETME